MDSNPDIILLYGSQTGNAEDVSKRIGYKAKALGYRVLVEAVDDFPLKALPKQKNIVFVCSTTGHGQEPGNMKNLYNFIRRRDLPEGCLSNLKYSVYGLGSTSYTRFNYVSKILYKRLKECGAEPIQELVAGDEQHRLGCDGIIYPRLEELWLKLGPKRPITSCSSSDDSLSNSYSVIFSKDNGACDNTEIFKQEYMAKYNIRTAFCKLNQRLTPESHFQETRLLCFRSETPINYEPGDVCNILPQNIDENAESFMKLLNLNAEDRFSVRKRDPNYMVNYLYDFIPDGLKVGELVKYYLDIQSVPKRSFFEFLWPFSSDKLERDKLREFASTEGQEEMYLYCVQPKRSILEVMQDFPNTISRIKFEFLFDLIPPIKPRSFSIACASRAYPNEVHLIVGVVKYQTKLRKIRKGLCSTYLSNLKTIETCDRSLADSRLRYFISRSSFKLPQNDDTPIVMIGPGLGIAPFRSFIQERAVKGQNLTNSHLYFGCRYKNADWYFRDEFDDFALHGTIRIQVAFSREEPKQYVQDLLLKDSRLIDELVKTENAVIYVAGNSKLPENLRPIFGKILSHNDMNGDELVENLEASGRIQYDCW